ncbi:hypothetical protein CCACVL1_04072 [Corchorus capsularis]|uniref:Uncharacterized protein n=1 Tax=Corchorus capsularis TaxID=210143 RepID=A0A1R3JVC4_COCAP|nr:hypothetical protein CCACVL1_04072 [Corchorus capsularis]
MAIENYGCGDLQQLVVEAATHY